MNSEICVIEKPDWVSWEDIKRCLNDSHAVNRAKGINMTHYQWPVEKIKESLGENGVMLVALDGEKLVGTTAIAEKFGNTWYVQGRYAYTCFGSVLPQYSGRGIYKALVRKCEEFVRSKSYTIMIGDTHENNKRIQGIYQKDGYRLVRFFQAASKDHYNVVMVKWLNGCPYSKLYCKWKFQVSKIKTLLLTKIFHR